MRVVSLKLMYKRYMYFPIELFFVLGRKSTFFLQHWASGSHGRQVVTPHPLYPLPQSVPLPDLLWGSGVRVPD